VAAPFRRCARGVLRWHSLAGRRGSGVRTWPSATVC